MNGGNGGASSGMSPAFAALQTHVFAIENELNSTVSRIETTQNTLNLKIDSISTKLEARSATNWPVLLLSGSLLVGVIGSFGWVAYTPIRERQDEHKVRITAIEEKIVPRTEHEREWARQEKSRMEVTARIEDNQKSLVTKETFSQTTQGIQRQIDEIRRDVGGVVTTRDALQNADRRIERLEAELRGLITKR